MGERYKFLLCISYWQCRKLPWFMSVIFPWNNFQCDHHINYYRAKIRTIEAQQRVRRVK